MLLGYCVVFVLISYSYGQSLTSSASVVKRPGESVTLSCTVSGLSLSYLHWIRQKSGQGLEWIGYIDSGTGTAFAQSLQGQFSITKDTNKNMLYLEVKSLKAEDTAVYYCARPGRGANDAFDYWGKGTSVTVTSATQEAPKSLFPVWQCGSSPDGFVTLGCVTRDLATPDGLSYVWKDASGTALTTNVVQYPAVSEGGKYSSVSQARVSANDWNANKLFTCEVTNPQGTKTAQLKKPEVTETPPNISISTSFDTTTNDTNLICWLDGFSPKGINVDWGAGKKGTEKKFQNEGKKEFAMLSQISINAQQWKEGKEFTCSATHKTKTVSQTWSICKGHPISEPRIRLEKPPLRSILTDTHVTVSCLVETVFQPTISWQVDGKKKSGTYIKRERQGESTVSNLTIPVEEWTKSKTITCKAEHPCFKTIEDQIKRTENVQKRPSDLRPTVEIRRSLADIGKRDSAVLECVASGLPSGELSVTFQANDEKFPEAQYMNLPEGQDTLVAPFTIPGTHRTKSYSFTCQIQLSDSLKWKSNSTGNLFDDPSVELSVQSSKSASTTQKLLCYGTGLNPEIKWLPQSIGNSVSEESMNKDGRVKASSELSVTEQEWKRGTTFTCQVRDQGGLKTAQKNISVCAVTPDHARKAQIYLLRPSVSDMQEKDPVSVTFLLLGQRVQDFSVNCKIDEENLTNVIKTENHGNGTESGRMVLKVPAKKWNDHSTVFCVVKHSCFNARTYNISKPKESKPPTIRIRSPSDDELAGSNDTALLCLIEGFLPADISVHWEVDNIKLDASRFKNSGPVQFASGGYSMQSALILSPLKKENGTFSCVVRHQSSTDLIKSEISNIYASVNKNPPSVKLLQSQDELVCLAYDYSPSDISITWLLNKQPVENNDIGSSAKGLDGKFMIKSHLNVKTSKWEPGSTYTCLVQHITGSVSLNVSKAEFIEKAIYIDDNKSDINTVDQAEETWNMACAFIILFVISLIYGCSITLVKVKTA